MRNRKFGTVKAIVGFIVAIAASITASVVQSFGISDLDLRAMGTAFALQQSYLILFLNFLIFAMAVFGLILYHMFTRNRDNWAKLHSRLPDIPFGMRRQQVFDKLVDLQDCFAAFPIEFGESTTLQHIELRPKAVLPLLPRPSTRSFFLVFEEGAFQHFGVSEGDA
jgi:hypothetical protein